MELITLKAPNGEDLTAPVKIWLLGLFATMTNDQLGAVFGKVQQMRDDSIARQFGGQGERLPILLKGNGEKPNEVTTDAAGKKHYTMHAEPGNYTGQLHGIGLTKKPH